MSRLEFKDGQFRGEIGEVAPFDVKQLTDEGEFEGYASTYGNVDEGNDIVKPGAFDESLRRRPAQKVKMLWQHRTDKPLGTWSQIVSDTKGLFVRGKLLLTTEGGKEAHELMKVGAIDGLSIGYRTLEYEFDRENEIRTIVRAELMEVSVVTFPMNEMATVNSVKSFESAIDGLETLSDAERFLREAGRAFTRKEATDFVSVIKRIAQREAGDDLGDGDEEIAVMRKLTQMMRETA